jgi:hypothetical protein
VGRQELRQNRRQHFRPKCWRAEPSAQPTPKGEQLEVRKRAEGEQRRGGADFARDLSRGWRRQTGESIEHVKAVGVRRFQLSAGFFVGHGVRAVGIHIWAANLQDAVGVGAK